MFLSVMAKLRQLLLASLGRDHSLYKCFPRRRRTIPPASVAAVPEHPGIFWPELVVPACQVHRTGSAVLIHAVPQTVDHRPADTIVTSRRLNPSLEK